METNKIIEKLVSLDWEFNEDKMMLTNRWNLSDTTCSGDYTEYNDGTIINAINIEYNVYLDSKGCDYIIWKDGDNPSNCNAIDDDFESVVEEALNDTLFKIIDFPEFEIIINSDNKMRAVWYDLVQIQENYYNSLSQRFEKGDYFIKYINNTNNNGDAEIYYPIKLEKVQELIKKDTDKAVDEMQLIVENF